MINNNLSLHINKRAEFAVSRADFTDKCAALPDDFLLLQKKGMY